MPRVPVSAGVKESPVAGITERQYQIIRLHFFEGMKLFKIAQVLRLSPKTIQREKTAALEALRTSEDELRNSLCGKIGPVRMDITIAYAPDDVKSSPDSTMRTVANILLVPGFREAYYAPDSSPDQVKAWIAKHDTRGFPTVKKKPKVRAA